MLKEIFKPILDNEGSEMLPIVGDYLLKGFIAIYNSCFMILLKIACLFVSDTYLTRIVVALLAFFLSISITLYSIKKIFKLIINLVLFILKNTIKLAFGGIANSISNWLKRTYAPIAIILKQLKFWNKSLKQYPTRELLKNFKIISLPEIEEFEKQLIKRGYSLDAFDLNEQLEDIVSPVPEHEKGRITVIRKENGKWKSYECGENSIWVDQFVEDLEEGCFE